MTRAERAAEATRLRGEGLLWRQVAERMGISKTYAHALVNDPDGTADRARKDSYRQPCIDCGTLVNGSDGPGHHERCVKCANVVNGAARKVWTRDAILTAIRSFAAEFGEPPAEADWCPTIARGTLHDEARAARFEARDDWPWFVTVVREFGSWSGGIAAAGFIPRVPHGGGGNLARRRDRRMVA